MVWCGPNLSKLDQILKKEWIDKIEGEITLKQKLTTNQKLELFHRPNKSFRHLFLTNFDYL